MNAIRLVARCTTRVPPVSAWTVTQRRCMGGHVVPVENQRRSFAVDRAFAKISAVSSADRTPSRALAKRFHEKGWQKRNRIRAERKKKTAFAQLNDALKRAVNDGGDVQI